MSSPFNIGEARLATTNNAIVPAMLNIVDILIQSCPTLLQVSKKNW